jgi:hypothetical protein
LTIPDIAEPYRYAQTFATSPASARSFLTVLRPEEAAGSPEDCFGNAPLTLMSMSLSEKPHHIWGLKQLSALGSEIERQRVVRVLLALSQIKSSAELS